MAKKYDWLFIIKDWKLISEFVGYKKKHPKVKSEKRLARSFVKSHHLPLCSYYEVGNTFSASEIAKVKWLDDYDKFGMSQMQWLGLKK